MCPGLPCSRSGLGHGAGHTDQSGSLALSAVSREAASGRQRFVPRSRPSTGRLRHQSPSAKSSPRQRSVDRCGRALTRADVAMWRDYGQQACLGPALRSVRTALILLLAVVVGGVAGALAFMAHHSVPEAFLVGGAAAGSALVLFDRMIGDR